MYLLTNMFSRIKVAILRKLKTVIVLNSKICRLSLLLIYRLGYLLSYKILNNKYIKLNLKYFLNNSVIRMLTKISSSSFRTYVNYKILKNLNSKNKSFSLGFLIFSTSNNNLITDVECYFMRIGGEPVFFIS